MNKIETNLNGENKMSTTRTPDENNKHEMAGRMYEALDIQNAIECGTLTTVDEILSSVKKSADGLAQLLKSNEWIINDKCCVDIVATTKNQA